MKKYFNKTTYSILIIVAFFSGVVYVRSAGIPLTRAPFCVNGTNCEGASGTITRGQYKQGPLTIGSSATHSSSLYIDKPTGGLKVTGLINCAQAPYTGVGAIPCPYAPYTANTPVGPSVRILGSGSGIGGYINAAVVGAPAYTPVTAQTSLDIHGSITADPGAGYLNYATGAYFSGSATDKPLCALANGDIVVCNTVTNGACGSANGTTITPPLNLSSPTLCSAGTASTAGVFAPIGTIAWNCLGTGGGTNAYCTATNANGGGFNGSGVNNGGGTSGTSNNGGSVQQGG